MIRWNQAPLVRLLIPFIIGILTAAFFPFSFRYGLYIVCILPLLISIIVCIPKLNISYRKSWWFGLLVNSSLLLLGYQLTILKTEKLSVNHFSKSIGTTQLIQVRLTEPCLEKQKTLKVIVDVKGIKQNNKWKNSCGKVMLYFQKDEKGLNLKYGDELVMMVKLKEIAGPQNPGEFDYKKFLSYHNIYHQAFVKNTDWFYSGNNTANVWQAAAFNLRNKLLEIFSDYNIRGNEFAVGSALLLGYEDKLDADIISAYSSTGVLHILSVSGLHVAIVYLVFNWFLFFLDKIKYGNLIKAVLLILLLWGYALLTGLSPSVLRSATMFSFIVIAKAYNRHTNIYNTLAASAFLLLLFDPFLLMDVGFQLSYLAVIGIVFIQPKIQNWLEPGNWLLKQIWIITSVSIAAQIATFPLSLYYFHQFPNYFLLSNLIVIPISTAIIYLGIGIFVFAKVAMLTIWLAMAFNWSVWFINQTVLEMENWPFALMSGISITVLETLLLYGLIISLFAYFIKPKFYFLIAFLGIVVAVICLQISEQVKQNKQKRLIVYNINKSSAIDFIDARANVLLVDTALSKNEKSLSFHIKNNWHNSGITQSTIISESIKKEHLLINKDVIQFYDKRIVVIKEGKLRGQKSDVSLKLLSLDYLIISKNKKINMVDVLKTYQTKMIVFDSSNPEFKISKWKKECENLGQCYYSVKDSGAFIVDL